MPKKREVLSLQN